MQCAVAKMLFNGNSMHAFLYIFWEGFSKIDHHLRHYFLCSTLFPIRSGKSIAKCGEVSRRHKLIRQLHRQTVRSINMLACDTHPIAKIMGQTWQEIASSHIGEI